MPEEVQQSYANHRVTPFPIIAISALGLLSMIAACVGLVYANSPLGLYLVGGAVIAQGLLLPVFTIVARQSTLTLQNRIIRLEMDLRLERVLPDDIRWRTGQLTLGQKIALRFASDDELPELARRVMDEGLLEPDAIKRAVTNWQADHQRV